MNTGCSTDNNDDDGVGYKPGENNRFHVKIKHS